jgi:hypothetical protein
MTIRRGTYYPATRCVGAAEQTTKDMMAYLLARFPGTRNGGTYGCRTIAGTTQLSVHAAGRAGDLMTETGSPTRVSKFLAEQMHIFSLQMGIQGLIHNRLNWWCNRGDAWYNYSGSNPHTDHIHWERIIDAPLSPYQIRALFQGPAPTGSKLTAGAVVRQGMSGTAVAHVQMRLNAHGFSLSVDGDCGALTVAAITTFQKLAGIKVDGIAGAETQGRLL